MSGRTWIGLGAVSGALAVAAGAFGAHALPSFDYPERAVQVFETASRYQMYHALGLVLVGLWDLDRPRRPLTVAGWMFGLGTVLFSGSLYALVLLDRRWLGMITPIGGLSFIAGWLALAVAAFNPGLGMRNAE